eukprot:566379-Hanusia_phi.AAC.2
MLQQAGRIAHILDRDLRWSTALHTVGAVVCFTAATLQPDRRMRTIPPAEMRRGYLGCSRTVTRSMGMVGV